jgi:hypothetical protein
MLGGHSCPPTLTLIAIVTEQIQDLAVQQQPGSKQETDFKIGEHVCLLTLSTQLTRGMAPTNRWVSENKRPTRNKILPMAAVPATTSTQSASCALEHFFSEAAWPLGMRLAIRDACKGYQSHCEKLEAADSKQAVRR